MANRNTVIRRIPKTLDEVIRDYQKFLIGLKQENVTFLKSAEKVGMIGKRSLCDFRVNLNSIKNTRRNRKDDIFR